MAFTNVNKIDSKEISSRLNKRFDELYNYWLQSIEDGEKFPAKLHFDPIDIPKLLSMLITVDIEFQDRAKKDEFRIFLRLIGTEMVTHWGVDHSGRYLDEILPEDIYDYVHEHFRMVIEEQRPYYCHYFMRWEDGRVSNASRIYLPYYCGGETGEVCHVVVGHIMSHDLTVVPKTFKDSIKTVEIIELESQLL